MKPKALTYKNAFTKFREKLEEYKASAKDLHLEAAELQDKTVNLEDFKIKQGNCITLLNELPADSVDLTVTSPPYYSVTDYVTSMRLSNLWWSTCKCHTLHRLSGVSFAASSWMDVKN